MMVRTFDASLFLGVWLAGVAGCNGSSSQGSPSDDPVRTTTHADAATAAAGGAGSEAPTCAYTTDEIQAQIIVPKCGLSACHTGDYPAGELDLTSPGLETRVAMVLGVDCVDRLASPGEHQYSMLWKKVRYDDPGCGERMPQGGPPLEDWEIDCIAQWIDAMPMPTEPPPASSSPPVEPVDAGPPPEACDAGQVLCGQKCIDEVEPTLTALFDRVWYPSCGASNSCHTGSNPKEYLWLDTRQSVLDAINHPSIQRPEVNLIEPGSAADSYIVMKLRGDGMSAKSSTGLTSMQMPRLAPALCEPLIEAVETWISEGAQDN